MAIRANLTPLVFLCSLLLLLTALSFASYREDPGLRQCRKQCRKQMGFDERQEQQCEQQCEDYFRQKHGSGNSVRRADPQQQHRYQECQQICQEQAQGEHQRRVCQQFCEEHFGGGGEDDNPEWEGSEEEQQENNPYVYQPEHFMATMSTEEGSVRVSERFSERSELLRGIENYRVAFLEANPNTCVLPHHWDAEALLYVASGRGIINLVDQNGRDTFRIKRGDILRIPSGTTVYLINNDDREKLFIVNLFQSIATSPRSLGVFFGAAGQYPESFYRALSIEILEAALNTPRDRLERLFGQQKKGAIVRATKEQIEALSKETEGGFRPSGGRSRDVFNLLRQRPTLANEFGQLYEASPSDSKQLRQVNSIVSLWNMTAGSMIGPFFNSKATMLATVVKGSGYFEMASPHISSSSSSTGQQKGGARYQKVRAALRPGTLFVVPADHPIVTVASKDESMELFCFEVNGLDNERIALAGKNNLVSQMQREALELSFNCPAREAERIFKQNQDKDFFFPGPYRRQKSDRAHA